jgi:dTDP-glucose pyrophosphorylase
LYIPKELLPVNGQPVICKIVSEILEISAVDEIIFVTSPEKSILKNTLEKYFLKKRACKFTFVVDKSHKGLDHSILLAKNYCKNAGATLLCWPDCFNKNNELKLLADNFKSSSLIGVTKVNDVRPYGNVIFDNLNKKIQKIIQKPKQNSKNKYVY